MTYVDDLLLGMPEEHLRPEASLLLKKHVMKKRDQQIGFLGCRITEMHLALFCATGEVHSALHE